LSAEPLLPLADVRVLDLTRNVAGPYASMILAELGADVLKVEHPGRGDDTREWGPPFWEGESPVFLALNRNKRSLTLDLKDPDAPGLLRRLAARSDVLIESFRPGVMEELGFGYDFAVMRDPAALKSPYGKGTYWWWGIAGTWFFNDPVNDLVFIGMIQRRGGAPGAANHEDLARAVVYKALTDPSK